MLLVCTGNVCRSPLAAQLLRHELDGRGVGPDRVQVSSAGVAALVGEPMTPQAVEQARSLGLQPQDHRGRQLTDAMIAEADLVLTAERRHRSWVVDRDPQAVHKTFLLLELAHLLAETTETGWTPPLGLDGLAARAVRRRSGVAPLDRDEVPDPYGRSRRHYRRTTQALAPAVRALAAAVAAQ
ncbi:low molecular weight phosphatase family protein [Angustibacter peucedani]